jgi:ABC-type branched-subunit amino acid transport system substrate-binding protein
VAGGARLALSEAGGEADGHPVRAVFLDDTGGGERWTLAAAAANAREAAQDSSSIGFIGDLDSGATRAALPITNQAGIAHISPADVARDLTHRVSEELTPERYRPSGDQTFVRLYPVGDAFELCPDQAFLDRVARRYGEGRAEAALGYEAMLLLIDAIGDAGSDREEVREAVTEPRRRTSVFGTYSVEESGDVRPAGAGPAGCS